MPVPDDLVVKNGMKISRATSAGIGSPLLLNSRIGWLVLAHADVDVGGMGFDGILGEIDEYLAQHVAVGLQRGILGEGNVPAEVGIERPDAFQERDERKGFYDGSLKLGELAVAIHEVGERLAGVVNRLNAFLVFASLDLRDC